MNTPILDTFVRTAELPLSDGGKWVTSLGPFSDPVAQTNGTQALTNAAQGSYSGSSWATPFTLPAEVYVTVAVLPVTAYVQLFWLSSPTSGTPTGYYLQVGPGFWQIINAFSFASLTSGSVTWAAGDSTGMSISTAGLITAWRQTAGVWSSLGSVTDTTYTGSGYIAFATGDTATRFTNFGGGTVVALPHHRSPRQAAQVQISSGRF